MSDEKQVKFTSQTMESVAMKDTFDINFIIVNDLWWLRYRRLYAVPAVGDYCVFEERRYKVVKIEWCLDDDACPVGTRINIEIEPVN